MKKIILAISAIAAISSSTSAFAGVECAENITQVILHANGQVYFKSDKTCTYNWCQVNWGTDEKNKSAYTLLLTAKVTAKPVAFWWENLSACTQSNVVYASPAYINMY